MRSATTVEATPDAIEQDIAGARAMLAALEKHGISLKEVTDELVTDGVQQFADAFDKLFGAIARRRRALIEGDRGGLEIAPGFPEMKTAYEHELETSGARMGSFGGFGPATNRFGPGPTKTSGSAGCTSSSTNLADVDRLQGFAEDVKQRGFTDVVLLGMGGSSLGPEVLGETFGRPIRLAAFPHAGQHRSRADQGDRMCRQSRQDPLHCLFQIRQHAGTEHFHGLFPRPRRRGAGQG